jgi:hypothetical protein
MNTYTDKRLEEHQSSKGSILLSQQGAPGQKQRHEHEWGDVRPENALSKMASTMRRTLFGAARSVSGEAMVVLNHAHVLQV